MDTFYVESETRLFIGGMGPSIREVDLRNHFHQFGVLQECSLKADLNSGKSKGYAFISYEDASAIQRVLAAAPHKLHDRILDVKRAKEIAEITEPAPESTSCLKIFVGALPESCTSYRLKEYFSKYGTVDSGIIITNHETGASRGFGFVTFRSLHAVKLVLEDYHDHCLDGKWIETKCCLPRNQEDRSHKGTPDLKNNHHAGIVGSSGHANHHVSDGNHHSNGHHAKGHHSIHGSSNVQLHSAHASGLHAGQGVHHHAHTSQGAHAHAGPHNHHHSIAQIGKAHGMAQQKTMTALAPRVPHLLSTPEHIDGRYPTKNYHGLWQ